MPKVDLATKQIGLGGCVPVLFEASAAVQCSRLQKKRTISRRSAAVLPVPLYTRGWASQVQSLSRPA